MRRRWRTLDVDAAPTGSLGGRGLDSIIGLAAQGLVRFALTFAVGRLAGPAELGVFATGLAIAQMLILLWPSTSGQAASRFVARARGRADRDELHGVLDHLGRRVLRAGLVLALACVPIWLFLEGGLGNLSLGDALAGCTVGAACAGLAGQAYTRGVHYGLGAVRRVVVLDIACSLAGLLGLVLALMSGVRGVALLLPPALAYLALSALCWPWRVHGAADPQLRRELDRFVLFGSMGTIASAGLIQFSLLASRAAGQAAGAGQYSAASSLALPLTLASGALSLVLYPSLSEAAGRGDHAGVSRQLDRGFRGVVLLVVPAVGVMALLARPLVALVWGAQFDLTAKLLPILLLAVLANVAGVPCVNAITGATGTGIARMAAVSFAGLAVAAVLWLLLVPTYGVPAVAVGYAAGVFLIAGYAVGEAWWRWRLSWAMPVALLLFAIIIIAGAPVLLHDAPWWQALLAAAGFVAVWAATHLPDIAWVRAALKR
ncbi:lipopolysaccharide biosynthesis protein [Gephyromycinifex aptenodytis]|uniref:lipopolysaccharide biosynthesis protein n=1 Tax=Gephyromycinifex aptenodytis TaxID=2716227 RepID=UPI0014468BFC|nr:lipopolysaccharide biosynthesis protein [Gephyromycinifex aptenodytis]